MRVLCLSTFDKFSRFYLDIKRDLETKTSEKLYFKVLSIYFSGFLYTLTRCQYSSWIALTVWLRAKRHKKRYLKVVNTSTVYKGWDFNSFTRFHTHLNNSTSVKELQIQALAYIDFFDNLYDRIQLDYLITIGDSRMCNEIAIAIAKSRNIKVRYIELGPFNTTFFDDHGVNANLSIRSIYKHHTSTDQLHKKCDSVLGDKNVSYNRSIVYRAMDMVFMKCFESTKLYPPDLKHTDLNSYISKRRKKKLSTKLLDIEQPYFLLILQVPVDVNMIYHSPHFKTHFEIVKSVFENLPHGTKLVIREHPLYVNKYSQKLYNYIDKYDIILDNNTPLKKAINQAKVIIVNNSTVGIEALFSYKVTVVLGNAFYDNDQICLKLKSKVQLKAILAEALVYSVNHKHINQFKALLFDTVMLEGSITDRNLKSSKQIAEYLIAHK